MLKAVEPSARKQSQPNAIRRVKAAFMGMATAAAEHSTPQPVGASRERIQSLALPVYLQTALPVLFPPATCCLSTCSIHASTGDSSGACSCLCHPVAAGTTSVRWWDAGAVRAHAGSRRHAPFVSSEAVCPAGGWSEIARLVVSCAPARPRCACLMSVVSVCLGVRSCPVLCRLVV